ncbi:MAG TPA: DUF523 domain-containing protein [Nitrospirota bacterium]|nr:DUF523 domain-containing protein [Nitrospirota bacterium]
MSKKIKIGISSCLLGNNVRYDGGNKLDQYLIDTLGRIVIWVPICPEVESGLPVPREAMQLVADGPRICLITMETKQDRTEVLARWGEKKLKRLEQEGVRGFVFKARSPSCGVHDAPFFSSSGDARGVGAGLFAKAVIKHFPSLPVEDEERLRDPAVRELFLRRL